MPHYDKRSGDIIVRVVYDGAPEAGKTTNIVVLKESLALTRKGRLASPGTTSRRTEFFDWLDFQGGYVEGRRVRCQLVSVPGQSSLLRRRRYLLETADSVVFVADSHRLLVQENRETFAQLRAALDRARQDVPVGIILQANKQDRPDSLPAEMLAERMELDPTIPRFDAQATAAVGVKETFLLAVRLAVERVKALALNDRIDDASAGFESPELLHELMLQDEGTAPPTEPAAPQHSRPTVVPEGDDADSDEPLAADRPEPDEPETGNEEAPAWTPPTRLPTASEIPAGCSWPPVTGRAVIAALEGSPVSVSDELRAWAPMGATELQVGRSVAHTHPDWTFGTLEEARRELVLAVRRCLQGVGRIPGARTLFIAPEADRYILWVTTPEVRSLAEELTDALAADAESRLGPLLAEVAILSDSPASECSLAHVAREERHLVVLSLPDVEPARSGLTREELVLRLRELASEPAGARRVSEAIDRARAAARSSAQRAALDDLADAALAERATDRHPSP